MAKKFKLLKSIKRLLLKNLELLNLLLQELFFLLILITLLLLTLHPFHPHYHYIHSNHTFILCSTCFGTLTCFCSPIHKPKCNNSTTSPIFLWTSHLSIFSPNPKITILSIWSWNQYLPNSIWNPSTIKPHSLWYPCWRINYWFWHWVKCWDFSLPI